MIRTLIVGLSIISSAAHANELLQCQYVLPHVGLDTFVATPTAANAWLERMRNDHSLPDWDAHAGCYPLNNITHSWKMYTESHDGRVSITNDLTAQECYTLLQKQYLTQRGAIKPDSYERGACFDPWPQAVTTE